MHMYNYINTKIQIIMQEKFNFITNNFRIGNKSIFIKNTPTLN